MCFSQIQLLDIDSGIRLMLTPKSHRAFSKTEFPMAQGMVKLPGSLSLGGDRCQIGCINWYENVCPFIQVYTSSLCNTMASQVSSHNEKCVNY